MSSLQKQFAQLLSNGPVDVFDFLGSNRDSKLEEQLEVLLLDQKRSWQTAAPKLVEEYLRQLPHMAKRPEAVVALAAGEFEAQTNTETKPSIEALTSRFPAVAVQLREELEKLQ